MPSFDINLVLDAFGLQNVGVASLASTPDGQPLLSTLGTPIFSDIRISSSQDSGDEVLLTTVLIDVVQEKNIITTAVANRDYTVKEFISEGDFQITVRGALVSEDAELYPSDQVRNLFFLLKKKHSLYVVCEYLRQFNIYQFVVTHYSFPQKEGFQNMQLFELSAISDDPIDLIEE